MKLLYTLTALLLAPLAAYTQPQPSAAMTVRDRLWLFAVHAGANNVEYQSKHHIENFAPGGSRMTPAEGAFWLGVPNLLFIRARDIPPLPSAEPGRWRTSFEQYAMSFAPLDRVVWSVVGAGGHGGMKELPPVLELAKKFPNITGVYLDDFIVKAKVQPDGHMVGQPAMRVDELKNAREQMKAAGRPLEIWATLYTHEINLARKLAAPVFQDCEPPLATFFDQFDVLTLWTWNSEEIPELEVNLAALEKLALKDARIALGLYFWDFQNRKPVPVDLMKHQCDLGLKWLTN